MGIPAASHAVPIGTSPHPDAPLFRTLSRRYPIAGLAEALRRRPFGRKSRNAGVRLEADDVRAILAYLESIQGVEQQQSRPKEQKG